MLLFEHLRSRYYDVTKFPLLGIDQQQCCVTFPIWNLSGQLIGYQVYRPNSTKTQKNDPREGRYFTRIKEQKVGVWGLESWMDSPSLFVCEGVFDACKLNFVANVSAIAVMTATISPQLTNWLWNVRKWRKVVVFGDGDAAGRKLLKHGHLGHQLPDNVDIGDMPEQDVKDLVEQYR